MRLVNVEKVLSREEIGNVVVNYKKLGGKKVTIVTTLFKGGMSVSEIAKELKDSGFSYQVVYTYCKNYSLVNGLETEGSRGSGVTENTKLILMMADQGLSCGEIAKKAKMTYQSVYSTLKRHGALNVRERVIQDKVAKVIKEAVKVETVESKEVVKVEEKVVPKKTVRRSSPEGVKKGSSVEKVEKVAASK